MDTAQGEVVHCLGMPSAKQMRLCRDAGRKMRTKGRRVEITINLKPSAELYDELAIKSESYKDLVPIDHKATVISAVFDFIDGLGRRQDPLV